MFSLLKIAMEVMCVCVCVWNVKRRQLENISTWSIIGNHRKQHEKGHLLGKVSIEALNWQDAILDVLRSAQTCREIEGKARRVHRIAHNNFGCACTSTVVEVAACCSSSTRIGWARMRTACVTLWCVAVAQRFRAIALCGPNGIGCFENLYSCVQRQHYQRNKRNDCEHAFSPLWSHVYTPVRKFVRDRESHSE